MKKNEMVYKAIILSVARKYNISPDDIVGTSRKHDVVKARFEAINRIWESTGLTLTEIGTMFGGRCPSTIHHAITLGTKGAR